MIRQFIKKIFSGHGRQRTYPPYYQQYLASYQMPESKKSIEAQEFVVLDTEASGLEPTQSQLLSIGAIKISNRSFCVDDALVIHLPVGSNPSEAEVAIHGIIKEKHSALTIEEAMPQLLSYIGSAIVVGHHIAFDIALLNQQLQNLGAGKIMNKTLDTAMLCRRLDNPMQPQSLPGKEYKLDHLCKRFDITPFARHTAEGDAYITGILFLKIINALSARGINKIKDLL